MQRTHARVITMLGALIVGVCATGQAQAQAGHTHTSPHGGDIVEVAGYHLEFKADSSGSIFVWLLDADEKTVAPPAGAKVTLIDPAGTQLALPLQVDAAAQRLETRFDPRKFATFQAIVSVRIAGRQHNLRFRHPMHH